MIRTWRGRLFWSVLGLAFGTWVVRMSKGGRMSATGRDGSMMRRTMRSMEAVRPMAVGMATKAGKAMMDTTVRTVRSLSRK